MKKTYRTIEELDCYCDTTERCKKTMIQCQKCRRWYHDACIHSLNQSILLSDSFYIFLCTNCYGGKEYLARIQLHWGDIVHLLLYNLSVIHAKRYFDLDSEIMPFFNDNHARFALTGKVANVPIPKRRQSIFIALWNYRKKKFKYRKSNSYMWSLLTLKPPSSPCLGVCYEKNDQNEYSLNFKFAKPRCTVVPIQVQSKKLKTKLEPRERLKHVKTNNEKTRTKSHETKLPNRSEVPPVARCLRARPSTKDESAISKSSLDTLIPCPPNFQECNPFKNLKRSRRSCSTNKKRKTSINNSTKPVPQSKSYELCNGKINGNNHSQTNGSAIGHPPINESSQTKALLKDNFSIIGRRVTTDGKVQYLFQWDV